MVLLAGCGVASRAAVPPVVPGRVAPAVRIQVPATGVARSRVRPLAVGVLGRSRARYIVIPRIGVNARVEDVGRAADGSVGVPPLSESNLAGWYRAGAAPGQAGAAVIVGHRDTVTGPAVFAELSRLRSGDPVAVVRADRTVAVFVVYGSVRTPKRAFPGDAVFARPRRPGLRLITCGGVFDRRRHSYEDNLIVFAQFSAAYRQSDLE